MVSPDLDGFRAFYEDTIGLETTIVAGTVDIATAEADHLVISPDSWQVRSAYPLWAGIQNFPPTKAN